MAKHRNPAELLAEAMKRVKDLQTKALQHSLQNHPSMVAMLEREKKAKSQLSKCAKWLDPEKGLEVRIERLKAQLTEAQERLENAEDYQVKYHKELTDIQQEKDTLLHTLSKDLEMEIS